MAVTGKITSVLTCGIALLVQTAPGQRPLAQSTISARAGTINYFVGSAYLDQTRVVTRPGPPLQMRNDQRLRVDSGRVEVLLGSGVYLRLGDKSAIRMQETQLSDIRVAMEDGSSLIEVAEMNKGAHLRVICGGSVIELKHDGLYRFDVAPRKLRVYNGSAEVVNGATVVTARKGQSVDLAGGAELSSFDLKESDALQSWSMRRSQQRINNQRRRLEARRMQEARRKAQMEDQQQSGPRNF